MEAKINVESSIKSNIKTVTKKEKFKRFLKRLAAQRTLQVMAILGVVWMIIFNYIPMYGLIIAFKQYSIIKPISEAPWIGLEHFLEFVQDDNFWLVLKNTLGISFIKLFIGFPLPIIKYLKGCNVWW